MDINVSACNLLTHLHSLYIPIACNKTKLVKYKTVLFILLLLVSIKSLLKSLTNIIHEVTMAKI